MKYFRLSKDEAIGDVMQQAGMIAMKMSLTLSAGILRIMAQTRPSGGAREDANEESRFQAFVTQDAKE